MFATTFKRLLGRAVLALGLALSANAAFADVVLSVNVNTATFGGGKGFLDFQFNAAGSGAPAATATMSGLNGFDLAGFDTPLGDVTALANGFVIGNTSLLNSVLYSTTFGGAFSFSLTFAGDAIDAISSHFSIQAYDENGNPPGALAGTELLGLDWHLLPTGVAGLTTSLNDPSISAVPAAAAVPEPSSLLLAALGLGLVGFMRRQRA